MVGNANANGIPFLKRYGIPPAIKNSMVLWYDIARQGATNESMAENPILKDLSGNGHDATCYNFAWSGMSGIGGYVFQPLDRWYKAPSNNGTYTVEGYTLRITKLNTRSNVYYICNTEGKNYVESIEGKTVTTKSFRIRINGLPDGKEVLIDGILPLAAGSEHTNILFPNQRFNSNGEHIVASVQATVESENDTWRGHVYYPRIIINSDTADDVDITIELLPEYPNALVSDGVDDYVYVKGLPILTDYTVIAKRKWLQTEGSNNDNFAAKGNILASFLIEKYGNNGSQECYSFGQYNGVNFAFQEDVIYQTKESYNGSPLKVGTAVDVDNLVILARTSAPLGCIQAALYSFLLFNRTLTANEIEWVKTNLISVSTNE